MNEEIRKRLLKSISSEIKKQEKEKRQTIENATQGKEIIDQTLEIINNNPYDIDQINYREISHVLLSQASSNIEELSSTSEFLNNLLSVREFAKEKRVGNITGADGIFEEDEEAIIETFKEMLQKAKQLEQSKLGEQAIAKLEEKNPYQILQEKLDPSIDSKDIINPDEIELIKTLIKEWPYDDKKEVYIGIVNDNNGKYKANPKAIMKEEVEETEEAIEEIDEELIKQLFGDNNIDISNMPKLFFRALQITSPYSKLLENMQYLVNKPEYKFLLSPEKRKDYLKLGEALSRSNPEIFDYLLKLSEEAEVSIDELYEVPGIFIEGEKVRKRRHRKNGRIDIPGPGEEPDNDNINEGEENTNDTEKNAFDTMPRHEALKEIKAILDDYSKVLGKRWGDDRVDLFKRGLQNNSGIILYSPSTIRKNIEYVETYGLSDLKRNEEINQERVRSAGEVPSINPFFLAMDNVLTNMDLAIESGRDFTNYICRFNQAFTLSPKFYYAINESRKHVYKVFNQRGEIVNDMKLQVNSYTKMLRSLDPNAKVSHITFKELMSNQAKEIVDKIPEEIKDQLKHPEIATATKPDEMIDKMDNFLKETEWGEKLPVYEVNGVLVSAHKFRRNWEIIKENNDGSMSEEEALLCSMVYPGTYTGENVKKLQEFVDKKQYNDERGGRQKWYF